MCSLQRSNIMSKANTKDYFLGSHKIPHHLVRHVMSKPRFLPGEYIDDYDPLREAMVDELEPKSNLEWLLCADLARIMWDIRPYPRWKDSIVAVNHRYAVEEAVRLTHPHWGFVAAPSAAVRMEIRKQLDAVDGDWKNDQQLNERLSVGDYDEEALNATAFVQAAS